MRLTRVHVETDLATGEHVLVTGAAANHIMRVLRLRAGDALTVFNGRGGEFGASIEEFRKDSVRVRVHEARAVERESPLVLTLAQGVSRGERMDWILQKSTELGASRIVPVLTERSVVRLDPKQAERKLHHWRGIAVAACEQSGRNRVPDIAAAIVFHDFLGSAGADSTRLLLSPGGELGIDDLSDVGAGVTVLIGPEGGLTEIEQESALRAGFTPVRMGPRVLRTETAAIAALTIIQQKFGDL